MMGLPDAVLTSVENNLDTRINDISVQGGMCTTKGHLVRTSIVWFQAVGDMETGCDQCVHARASFGNSAWWTLGFVV